MFLEYITHNPVYFVSMGEVFWMPSEKTTDEYFDVSALFITHIIRYLDCQGLQKIILVIIRMDFPNNKNHLNDG